MDLLPEAQTAGLDENVRLWLVLLGASLSAVLYARSGTGGIRCTAEGFEIRKENFSSFTHFRFSSQDLPGPIDSHSVVCYRDRQRRQRDKSGSGRNRNPSID
jgi:hypothetical protein